ncbi:MAG: fasciclin domain-containing protein [Spirosomataceae bacterium]
MYKRLLSLWPCLVVLIGFIVSSCSNKEWDSVYDRPANLDPPIYQQLQQKGRFQTLLALIDKSGYQRTLSSAGYWTFFAPNDDAFQKYFQKNNLTIGAIDSTKAREIVQYLLVYNAFARDRIDDYQGPNGWIPSKAFRRRTAFYTGFYNDANIDGQNLKAVAGNRNYNQFVSADNNNKHISYFTTEYFADKSLVNSDYTYFFPDVAYTGFNVMDSKVLEKDIVAENGVIHEIDNVLAPPPSIDQYLRTKPEYSEFRKLYEKYIVNFVPNADATNKYQILTGKSDQVYVKLYSKQQLAFSPNNENYLKFADNDAQQDFWSIFVPTNDVLTPYIKSVLLENYTSLDNVPPQVVADFLNAHMWATAVWPSKFKSTYNSFAEEARFDPAANVVDRKMLSNGLFYGTNKVQEANVFATVFGKAYLDPKYSIMTRLLNLDLRPVILNPKLKYTVFLMSDAAIAAAGYDYDIAKNEWGYTAPGTTTRTTGDGVKNRLLRIVATSIISTANNELDNLAGSGIIDAFNGEYIKFDKNTVYSAGTQDKPLKILSTKTAQNGRVYYTDGILNFTELNIGKHIETLGTATTSPFNFFWQYLKNSAAAYNATTGEILGTSAGTFYTVFIPDNTAIQAAVNAGLLPGTGTGATKTPNFAPTTPKDQQLVVNFIYSHILNKRTVIPDGKDSGAMETMAKDNKGDAVMVTVISKPGDMQITDALNRRAKVNISRSNNLSNRTVIHLIDNYLQYQ